jgi:hypothetical protein
MNFNFATFGKKRDLVFTILVCNFLIAGLLTIQKVESRIEEIFDETNNNLKLSFNAPDKWNSGKISATVVTLNWRLNGLFATDIANNLFASKDSFGVFAVINSPSLTSMLLPLGEKSGLLSYLLSQYVTINNESTIKLTDGTVGHAYFISVTAEQIRKMNLPFNEAFDGIFITVPFHGSTYFVIYATPAGSSPQYENLFSSILNSVRFDSIGFSPQGE